MENNIGKVGKALYLKMRSGDLPSKRNIKHGDVLNVEQLSSMGITSLVDIHVDDYTLGDYECVCENGTEIHYPKEKEMNVVKINMGDILELDGYKFRICKYDKQSKIADEITFHELEYTLLAI
jgi:hypothetical protein